MGAAGDPAAERRKRAKVYGLRAFMGAVGFAGAFRDNVRAFLREFANPEARATAGMPTWLTLLVDEKSGAAAPLYTVEESVRLSSKPFCDHCRCAGWSHHLVSKRRYHFIVPAEDEWDRACLHPDALQLQTHLVHGLLHCNGFGHLLSLNGRSSGATLLPGSTLMDLWDRLCSALRSREVTVEDVAQMRTMELRLLLGVAHGITWFSRWGYSFRMGSFGVTREHFARALEELASLDVDALLAESASAGRDHQQLRSVVLAYRRLRQADPGASRPGLATARDLLRYMLDVRRRIPPPQLALKALNIATPLEKRATVAQREGKRKRCRAFAEVAAELASRWSARRLLTAAEVVVGALRERGGMTRQEVRDAARLTIGDTGLIDFVLKSLGDCIVGPHLVRRGRNPCNRVLEFSLEDLRENTNPNTEQQQVVEWPSAGQVEKNVGLVYKALMSARPDDEQQQVIKWPSAGQVEKDVGVVYKALMSARADTAQVVLDGKHWGKSWGLRDDEDDMLRFLINWGDARSSPPEVVVVAPHESLGELRAKAELALRDTYCSLEGFKVVALDGIVGEDWDPVLLGGAESGAVLRARGEAETEKEKAREEVGYEGGAETWAVGCGCGARDDDGERMVACDVCDVWHHTRCVGIGDDDPVPTLFLCSRCGSSLLGLPPAASAAIAV